MNKQKSNEGDGTKDGGNGEGPPPDPDDVLRQMLKTPPKPHKPPAKPGDKSK